MSSDPDEKKILQNQLGESSFAEFDLTSKEVIIKWKSQDDQLNENRPSIVLLVFDLAGQRLLESIETIVFSFFAKETEAQKKIKNFEDNLDISYSYKNVNKKMDGYIFAFSYNSALKEFEIPKHYQFSQRYLLELDLKEENIKGTRLELLAKILDYIIQNRNKPK